MGRIISALIFSRTAEEGKDVGTIVRYDTVDMQIKYSTPNQPRAG